MKVDDTGNETETNKVRTYWVIGINSDEQKFCVY